MKILTLSILVASLAVAGLAGAQTPPPQTGAPQAAHRNLLLEALEKVGLNAEQTAKIKQLEIQHKEEAKSIRKQYMKPADLPAMKEKMKEVNKAYLKSLMDVLTPAQQVKLKEIRKAERQEKKAGTTPPPHN